jgi:hypothetical protein
MSTIHPTRVDSWTVTLEVENPTQPGVMVDFGIWDKKAGGDVDSEERIYYPGAMGPPISLGGRVTVTQVTLSRLYRLQRDHTGYPAGKEGGISMLIAAVGGSDVKISQTPMDIHSHKITTGVTPIVYLGTLKTVNIPTHDSEASDPALVEVVCSIAAPPTKT